MSDVSADADKGIVFISHANPEDNYFAGWLASKLRMLGYNSWVDVHEFNPSDAFMTKVAPIIRDSAVFIAVNSKDYLSKERDQNTGVAREINTAMSVRNRGKFILPIKIDKSSFDDFPAAYAGWYTIDFSHNWQSGLIELVEALQKRNIPKSAVSENPIKLWYDTIQSEGQVIEKRELYCSNWLPIDLPEHIYVHQLSAIDVFEGAQFPYPFILESNFLICFTSTSEAEKYIGISGSLRFFTSEFLKTTELHLGGNASIIEPNKKLVKLLNVAFGRHLVNKGLSHWKRRRLYYFQQSEDSYVDLSHYGKGRRVLQGTKHYKTKKSDMNIRWHYAVSPRAVLHPMPYFRYDYTLAFTNENGMGLNTDDSRKLRRSVPADWFNRKWYEMMLASLAFLSGGEKNGNILIPVDEDIFIGVSGNPVSGESNRGYIEP